MKQLNYVILLALALSLSGCEVVGDIFGAGVYVGMFIVIFVIVLIAVIIRKIFKN